MSEEKPEPKTVRTPDVEAAPGQTAEPSATLKATDTTPTALPVDTVYTRPNNPSPAAAIVDPDNDERAALRNFARALPAHEANHPTAVMDQDDDTPAKYINAESPFRRMLGKTPGERDFNLKSWFGIGLGANSLLSLAVATHAKGGRPQPFFERVYTAVGNAWPTRWGKPKFTPEDVFQANDFLGKVKTAVENHAPARHILHDTDRHYEVGKYFEQVEKAFGSAKHLAETLGHSETAYNALKETAVALQKSRGWAKYVTNFAFLGTGGWLLMIPIEMREKKKASKIREYDAKYEKTHFLTNEEKSEIAKRHRELDNEPQQSWSSVLASRAVSYVAIVTAYLLTASRWNVLSRFTGMKNFKGVDHYAEVVGEKIADGLRRNSATTDIIRGAENLLDRGPAKLEKEYAGSENPYQNNFQRKTGKERFTGIVVDTLTEGVYTTVMAVMTFVASWFMVDVLGTNRDEVHPKRRRQPKPQEPAPMAAPAPLVASASPESPGTPLLQVNSAEHQGAAHAAARQASKVSEPMASYRDLAAQSQISGGEPARA